MKWTDGYKSPAAPYWQADPIALNWAIHLLAFSGSQKSHDPLPEGFLRTPLTAWALVRGGSGT